MIELTKRIIGEESVVLLLAVPYAMECYPKEGLEKVDNRFVIKRIN